MRVLGIDPGLRNMGWGVIEVHGSRITHVANGVCNSLATDDLGTRLASLHAQLTHVLITYGPDAADALAIAICHAHHAQSAGRLADALARASA